MYNYHEIDNLKSQRRKLEIEQVEERFHYESIPQRKALSKTKALLSLICAIPLTIALSVMLIGLVLAIRYIMAENEPSFLAAACTLVIPAAVLPLGFFTLKIWSEFVEAMRLICGTRSKELNYGSANYRQEAKLSQEKLRLIHSRIVEIDKILADYNRETWQESSPATASNSNHEDDFFSYAYGHWGDERETLLANMSSDKYEQEATSLRGRIAEQEEMIMTLARRLAKINSDYVYIKKKFWIYIGSLILIVASQLFILTSMSSQIALVITGAIYMLIVTAYMIITCKDEFFAYQVEYNYHKFKDYAETHYIEPVATSRYKCARKIEDFSRRLEYVERLLEYKSKLLESSKEN